MSSEEIKQAIIVRNDLKMGVPLTEGDLDLHLDALVRLVTHVFTKTQPAHKEPEMPM